MIWKLHEARGRILVWIVANFLGVAAVGGLSLIPFLTSIHVRWVPFLLIGLPIGFVQWVALRRIAPISILWVLTISAALPFGLAVTPLVTQIWGNIDDESALAMTAFVTTIGLFIGFAQWLVLRRHFSKSLVWLLSTAVGLGLGFAFILGTNLIDHGLTSIILVTLVYSIVTGLTILWMQVSGTEIDSNLANAT
ncbi:MAG: hypothetical protein ACK2T3_00650 [Candidatus Promineifilaceae bacterium]